MSSGPGAIAPVGCPDEAAVLAFLEGAGEEADRATMRTHLDGCDACRELVAALIREQEPEDSAPLLARGATLGRYVVVDVVGRGAMGVVYRAFDPDLDRRVAIKVLRSDGPADPARGARLLAEAQAMAKLSHPNVITIYDVGLAEGTVFLAMEFVRGSTLRAVAGPWRRRLGLYLQAGEGLAAAHAAGIVHRDFKPENVLVGEDGRARVTDFGLASHERSVIPERLQVGTPAYMAPEQARGEPGDARADQYSFCVALHEALWGDRPGRERSVGQGPVPRPMRAVIERGLSVDPSARWPSMRALLDALSSAATIWTRGRAAVLAGLAFAALAAWANHAWAVHRAETTLARAADHLPALVAGLHERAAMQTAKALGSGGVVTAFANASDLDAALGLAAPSEAAEQIAGAHDLLLSADLAELKDEDCLLLVNAWGEILYDRNDERLFGKIAPNLPILSRAMQGVQSAAIVSADAVQRLPVRLFARDAGASLFVISAFPVRRGPTLIGAVLVGTALRPGELAQWGQALGVRLVLEAADGTKSDPALARELPWTSDLRVLWRHGQQLASLGVRLALPGDAGPSARATLARRVDELPPGIERLSPLLRWGLLLGALIAALASLRRWRLAR